MTLKQLRVAKGLNQESLASLVGIAGNSTVSLWERGKVIPSIDTYDKLVSVLGEAPDDIPRINRRGRPIGS